MTNLTALDALIEAVEAGRAIAVSAKSVALAFGWKFPDMRLRHVLEAEAGSLDAAKALHDALLPELLWQRHPTGQFNLFNRDGEEVSYAFDKENNPARAWLIAILKAYRSMM